ncbi:MAG TPA: GGDEF and EAL domain-containing protein [Hyphomicrobiaceae bacterium]|nr:GGDEF and EAL domain-containing protein [Hyphomicrobiaceae bacterium]
MSALPDPNSQLFATAGLVRAVEAGSETELPVEREAFDLVGVLSSLNETAYVWDAITDVIAWESNALKVLHAPNLGVIDTGNAFEKNVSLEHIKRRQDAISGLGADQRPMADGHTFKVQYRFTAADRRFGTSLWLEDHGRVWTDALGHVLRVRGAIRVVDDPQSSNDLSQARADLDELTGQLNRTRLTEALTSAIKAAQASNQPVAFLVVAINNLSMINQTFGFDVGDEVIAATARTMKKKLRGGDVLGRYSANKFGVILNDCGPGAMRIASDRFLKAVRDEEIRTSACNVAATISIGGVLIPDQAYTTQQAISNALQALDQAKQKRFDCFVAFEPNATFETTRQRNIGIADEVSAALEEHRMMLMLQPIVDAKTLETKHYECLLRMEKADGSRVSAGEFMPIAEQLGMSRLIDMRTLQLAVDLLKQYPSISLALNISGLTPANHDWLVMLHRLTGGRKALTNRLIVEITETAAINDIDQTVAFCDALKELGCKTAIDDFGAGYTSFKNLKLLSVDMVKIDGAFIKNLATDAQDLVFIRALRDLAHSFNIETVAEWVQDQETVDILREAGINLLQGYYCGEPIPAHALPPTGK